MSYPPKTVAWETFEEATRSLAAEVCKREALEAAHAGAMALHEADAKQWLEQKASLEAQLAEARRRIEEEEGNYVSALERGDNAIRQLAERTRDRDENSRQCADEYSARRKAEAEVQRLQGELEQAREDIAVLATPLLSVEALRALPYQPPAPEEDKGQRPERAMKKSNDEGDDL